MRDSEPAPPLRQGHSSQQHLLRPWGRLARAEKVRGRGADRRKRSPLLPHPFLRKGEKVGKGQPELMPLHGALGQPLLRLPECLVILVLLCEVSVSQAPSVLPESIE